MVVQKTRTGPDSLVEHPSLCLVDGRIVKILENIGAFWNLLETSAAPRVISRSHTQPLGIAAG